MNNQKTRTLFGTNLRCIRLEHGLTQTQLGERVGLSKRMIAHYERHASRPPAEKVAALAQALHVKTDDFMKGNGTARTPRTDPKFARKLEKAKRLPKSDREVLTTMIDSLLKKSRSSQ